MSNALVVHEITHLQFPPFHFPEAYQGGNAWPNDQNALKGVEGGGGSALCQDLSTVHRGPSKVIILNDNMITYLIFVIFFTLTHFES